MSLRKSIDYIVTKIKGEPFIIDKNIPLGYLFSFFMHKACCLIIGIFKFRRLGKIFVHPTSKIKCSAKIKTGKNLNIDRRCYIDALSVHGIRFGNNVSIGKNTTIECSGTMRDIGYGLNVGENVGLGTHGFLGCAGGIKIGDNTILGNYVSMHSENHNFENRDIPIRLQGINRLGITIGKDCWIGAKVTILDGAKIGDGCVIAAGTVVKGCIPAYSVVAGVPGKVIKTRG